MLDGSRFSKAVTREMNQIIADRSWDHGDAITCGMTFHAVAW